MVSAALYIGSTGTCDDVGCLLCSAETIPSGLMKGVKGLEASDIILCGVHKTSAQSVFCSLMHIIDTQFPEDVLPMGVHRMET